MGYLLRTPKLSGVRAVPLFRLDVLTLLSPLVNFLATSTQSLVPQVSSFLQTYARTVALLRPVDFGINSNYNTLINSQCTSCEIQADKSAYWTPLLYYQYPNDSLVDVPHNGGVVYYLGRGVAKGNLKPFPKGFQIPSGDALARSYNEATMTWGNATYPNRPIA